MSPVGRLVRGIEAATAVLLGLCMGAVFLNAVLRFGFDSGIMMTEELSRIALVWIVFFGAIAALHGRHHIGMTMLVDKLPAGARRASALATGVLMLGCDLLLVVGASKQALLSLNDGYPVSGLPLAVLYLPAVVAGSLFAVITAGRLVLVLTGRLPFEQLLCAVGEDAEVLDHDTVRA